MVMHARKQPRLNDGYADRKDTHLHQNVQYHSSLFVDGSDDNGPLGSRVSPRYQNKSAYIERNKEKRGSLSLAEKKVSHYLATGSLGRPINLESSYTEGSEGGGASNAGGYHEQHRSSASSSSHHRKERATTDRGRDYNSQHHHGSSSSSTPHKGGEQSREYAGHHPERENRSHTSTTTSSTNNGKQASSSSSKEVSAQQVQKSAIRVCGDWSEHISSSGKRYYYNCKTEVSQWEKPKDWISEMCKTPDHRSKDGRQRLQSQTPHANKITADSRGSRHSSSSEHQQHEHPRHRANSGENTSDSFPGRDSNPSSVPNTHSSSQHNRDRDRDRDSRDSRESYRNRLSVDSNSNNSNLTYPPQHHQQHHHHHSHQRSGSTPGGNNGIPESHQDYSRSYSQYESQHHHQYSSSEYKRQGNDIGRRRRGEGYGSHRFHDTGQGRIDDMDISPSPSPSPSSSQPSSAVGTPQQLPPTSTPGTGDTASSHYHNSTTPQPQRAASPQGNPIPTLVNRQTAAPEGEAYDATIQTLRKLQNALSMHIIRAQQSNTTGSSGRSSSSQPTGRQPGAVSNSSSSASLVPQQQLQQQQQSLQQQQHPAVMMGGTTIPGIQPQHLMYQTGHQQQPQQQQGLLPIPHHHPYQQQPPQQQHMLPGLAGAPIVAGAGPGQTLSQQPQPDEAMGGRTSPVSATSSRSSCGSPTPSDSSSQNAALAGSSQALTAAAIKREETAKLTASLSNYYNEKLIGHVLGWQADGIEKQSTKLWEEWMVNGSLQASQISVQLKRVRSQVRIAEIQSTLHEQRIMSSEQQRQEIENLKTPSNFLPS